MNQRMIRKGISHERSQVHRYEKENNGRLDTVIATIILPKNSVDVYTFIVYFFKFWVGKTLKKADP
jgi:hypothetical protein